MCDMGCRLTFAAEKRALLVPDLKAPSATFEAKMNIQFQVFFTRSIFQYLPTITNRHSRSEDETSLCGEN